MRSRREAVSGASAKYSFLLLSDSRAQEPTHLLPVADSWELGYGLLNFIRFKFTTEPPISHLATVSVAQHTFKDGKLLLFRAKMK